MNSSPVFIVDSDFDDQELLEEAWKELGLSNKLYFFKNAEDALKVLEDKNSTPFLIISEIKLPKMSGFEFKKYLLDHHSTHYKSIPFVFLSAAISPSQVVNAYDLGSNGLFIKHSSFNKLKTQLIDITRYWRESLVPTEQENQIAFS